MVRDLVRERGVELLYAQHPNHELRELVHPAGERLRLAPQTRVMREKGGKIVADHPAAGARWRDDVLGAGECFDELPSDGSRFVLVAAVERGLPAADLRFGEVDLTAIAPEHARHAHPHLGL